MRKGREQRRIIGTCEVFVLAVNAFWTDRQGVVSGFSVGRQNFVDPNPGADDGRHHQLKSSTHGFTLMAKGEPN